jgi:hypothetical protein
MKRHELDPISLVFGLLFLGVGLWIASGRFSLASLDNDWVWPALAIGAGLILVLPAAVRVRAERTTDTDDALEPERGE